MCGIAGILNYRGNPISQEVLKKMLGQIRYRGPDECGIYIQQNIGIGNVRLSIIDIATGQQPMPNDDNTLWIVYNGEVFNYIELREDLIKKGIHFKTDSDTEVVLKYYEFYGKDCLRFFNGQFAFSIWDERKKELFLARDRVGIRPLFYSHTNENFIFGSEIKVILESGMLDANINFEGLQQVFTFWTTINSNTCFEGINELPPGHYAKVSKGKINMEEYWSLDFPTDEKNCITDLSQASSELGELLEDAVRIRLRADVQVAAYLSGGIDSSATTYLIKKVARDQLNTFSIGFADKEFDESVYQSEVAKYLDTQHLGFICTNQQIADSFPDVIWHAEYPLLRTAPVPMYLLSKNVRHNNIKVVITGEGADEMLGGYNIFKEMYIRRFWAKFPNSKYRPLLLKKLYPYIPQLQNQQGNMLKFFFGYKLNETESPFYSHLLRWNNTSKITGYFTPELIHSLSNTNPLDDVQNLLNPSFTQYSSLAKAQWLEVKIFLSGYLLSSQGDRMAMANSVEGRYPFLDYRVIEYCTRLHPDLKLNGLNEKYLLKKMMLGKIPDSVLKRPKQAYRAPIIKSFLNEKAPSYVRELLSEAVIKDFGIFNIVKVNSLQKKLAKFSVSEVDNMALAAILSTQILYQKFVMKKAVKGANMTDCKIVRFD